ncbi:MAG: hypothetical protein GY847_05935 [Proteobacteria bacterium]|nr:hypothetical protein [Pseudomonadota bacterium]
MKWLKTCIVAVFVFTAQSAFSEQNGPWTFNNITVLTFPSSEVQVRQTADRRGVDISLPIWNPQIEKAVKHTLARSPLSYRLHFLPRAAMGVEVYSLTTDIDYAARRQKKVTQIIIGELRPERVSSDLIGSKDRINPISEKTRELLRAGKMVSARREITKIEITNKYMRLLYRARWAVLDSLIYGADSMQCPRLPRDLTHPMVHEGVFLSAWCLRAAGQLVRALYYLHTLGLSDVSPEQAKRIRELSAQVVAGLVLSADRSDSHIYAAAYSIKHQDIISAYLTDASFLEVVAANLGKAGVGNLFVRIANAEIAKIEDEKQATLAPVLVESFLNAGQYIRALDSASFFLSGRQPKWYEARLQRVRGHAHFQEGNWREADIDLNVAKQHLTNWNLDDELSSIETFLRAGHPVALLGDRFKHAYSGRPRNLPDSYPHWFTRLKGEIDLKSNRMPKNSVLDKLPTYVLVQGAKKAKQNGRDKAYLQLIHRAAKGEGGWRDLAKLNIELVNMKNEIAIIKHGLEVML